MENNTDYKLENKEEILDVLREYHEQAVEDCRIIGNQKYNILISLSIALGSFIFALTQVYNSVKIQNSSETCLVTFNTLSGHLQNFLSSCDNVFHFSLDFLSGSEHVIDFSPNLAAVNALIISLLLFIIVFFMAIHGFFFLWLHLPKMDNLAVQIEELQRDIIFKKMGDLELFSWKKICVNESDKFKDYIKQKLVRKNLFILEDIYTVSTDQNDNEIQIYKTIKYIPKKYIREIGKKIGTLSIDEDKKTAIITVDGIVLDHLNVKKTKDSYILYESELKYRFGNLMPHTNVLKPSYILNLKILIVTLAVFSVAIGYIL